MTHGQIQSGEGLRVGGWVVLGWVGESCWENGDNCIRSSIKNDKKKIKEQAENKPRLV